LGLATEAQSRRIAQLGGAGSKAPEGGFNISYDLVVDQNKA
jgi:hypothetical protein